MSAFTDVSKVWEMPAPAGGDGVKMIMGTCKGTASYDTGGSDLDLSDHFASKVYYVQLNVDNADYRAMFVPGSSYATTCKIFLDDNAGTEVGSTTDTSTPLATCEFIAWGTDA